MLFSCVYGEADRRRPPVTETGTRCRCGSRSSSSSPMYLLLPVTQIAGFSFRACLAAGQDDVDGPVGRFGYEMLATDQNPACFSGLA
jgi:hypothetical protein